MRPMVRSFPLASGRRSFLPSFLLVECGQQAGKARAVVEVSWRCSRTVASTRSVWTDWQRGSTAWLLERSVRVALAGGGWPPAASG
jgi:hypothetical protein